MRRVTSALAGGMRVPVRFTGHISPSLVTRKAPDFSSTALMPDGSFKPLTLSKDFAGKYVLLFFYPFDFTFVCPTEIVAFSNRVAEFEKLNCAVVGCSIDSHFTHLAWTQRPRTEGGIGKVSYPLLADVTKSVATDYGVLLPGGMALRGTFVIDDKGKVRCAQVNDLPIGRSVDECLRLVTACQHADTHGEVCPADWKPGAAAMTPGAKAKEYFSKHLK